MAPKIITIGPKKLIGIKQTMSLNENKTFELWRSFMPRRKEIKNNLSANLFSMQVYNDTYFKNFNPATPFEKWASMEVPDFKSIPEGMETHTLKGGLYAVFHYVGSSDMASASKFFMYIFETWLPQSAYELDNREHFEILGEKYKPNDPASEEDIYIPVTQK